MEGKLMAKFSSLYNNNHILVGSIIAVSADNVPYGFLECNGAEISRDAYADLYAVIGDTYGSGDGSTTFNIPDLRGEFLRGWDNGRGVDENRNIGTWQNDDFKSHTHLYQGFHNTGTGGGGAADQGYAQALDSNKWTSDAKGGKETRPRNIAIMYCIKY
jgi:microcystin-dependent protein